MANALIKQLSTLWAHSSWGRIVFAPPPPPPPPPPMIKLPLWLLLLSFDHAMHFTAFIHLISWNYHIRENTLERILKDWKSELQLTCKGCWFCSCFLFPYFACLNKCDRKNRAIIWRIKLFFLYTSIYLSCLELTSWSMLLWHSTIFGRHAEKRLCLWFWDKLSSNLVNFNLSIPL